MVLQTVQNMYRRGITLLELLISIAILLLVVYLLVNAYQQFLDGQRMNEAVENTVSILQKARELTLSSQGNVQYGIHIDSTATSTPNTPNRIVLFKTNNYYYQNPTTPNNPVNSYVNIVEVVPIKFPVIISSFALYPKQENAFIQEDIVFDRITGGVSVINVPFGSNTTSNAGAVSTPLDTVTKSDIFLRSQQTGNMRAIRIYRSGVIEVRKMPDAWWSFDENNSSNQTVYDATGRYNGLRGTNSSVEANYDPVYTTGADAKFFSAFRFTPGVPAYLGYGSRIKLGYSSGIFQMCAGCSGFKRGPTTVMAWIKPMDFANWQAIYEIGGKGNANVIGLTDTGKLRFLVRYGNTADYRCVDTQASLSGYSGQWVHVAGVLHSGGASPMEIYINGVSVPTYVTGQTAGTTCVSYRPAAGHNFPYFWQTGDGGHTIGANTDLGDNESAMRGWQSGPTYDPVGAYDPSVTPEYFNGYIDEVKVWDRDLSATEVQEEMNVPYH